MVRMRERTMQQQTYADYLTWSATSGDELIDGVAYVGEPPAPSRLHQDFIVELCRQLATSLLDKPRRVYIAPFDVRLPKAGAIDDDQIDTVVQPDILIAGDLQKLDDRGMRGAPDWIAEVLSPSTANYDRTTKLRAYERAGVPEVWLIDLADSTVAIYRMAAGHYPKAVRLQLRGQTALSAVPGVGIDWDRLLAVIGQSR